jgi:hypothetical protein
MDQELEDMYYEYKEEIRELEIENAILQGDCLVCNPDFVAVAIAENRSRIAELSAYIIYIQNQ